MICSIRNEDYTIFEFLWKYKRRVLEQEISSFKLQEREREKGLVLAYLSMMTVTRISSSLMC